MNWPKMFKNFGLLAMISAPFCGYLYVNSKMVNMEKGIHDDLARIKSKGKTLADVPRKY
jgi:hypothetical protein